MLSKVGPVVLATSFFFASVVKADSFSLTGTGSSTKINIVISGIQSATQGVFDITSIDSGTIDGQSATLLPTSPLGAISDSPVVDGWYIEYDNRLYLNQPCVVDYDGLGFILKDGTLGNIYYKGGYLWAQLGDNPVIPETITLRVVQTPEPGSLLMLCGGLLILGSLVIRKQLF